MSMSQFEVALAMCLHFAPCSSMEEASKKKATFHKQEETKKSELSSASSSLFEVCERHMEELVVAKFLVGWCCARGVGGVAKKDEERAVMLYRQAAAQGYPAAQFHLGLYHLSQGGGDEGASCSSISNKNQREQEAVRWFKKAAYQGHVGAQLRLMKCYQLGEGVEVDWAMGEKWLQCARAVQPNEVEGVVRLHRLSAAAEQGNVVYAQSNLGQPLQQECKIHLGGGQESTSSLMSSSMVQVYMWAAECFEHGNEDQDQDTVEAVRLYRLSAEQGDADAQFNLGVCYATGTGVLRDESEAVRLYRQSAEQGHAYAQYNLGVCYATGTGVQSRQPGCTDCQQSKAMQMRSLILECVMPMAEESSAMKSRQSGCLHCQQSKAMQLHRDFFNTVLFLSMHEVGEHDSTRHNTHLD